MAHQDCGLGMAVLSKSFLQDLIKLQEQEDEERTI
jgi:hypothetical protein